MNVNRNSLFFEKLKQNVTDSFDRLRKAVDMREKLLLRQLTVVLQQSQHITYEFDTIKFIDDGEEELVGRVRTYGRYNIDNFNIILKDPYENEDYILPSNDHDLMHKSCRQGTEDERDPESEEIVVEFFNNRSLIKDSAEMVRESIINLTLTESRELIDQTIGGGVALGRPGQLIDQTANWVTEDVPRCEEKAKVTAIDVCCDDNGNGNGDCVIEKPVPLATTQRMIPKASQTDMGSVGRRATLETDSEGNNIACKPSKVVDKRLLKNVGHLTMSSCGGTINLKNVTNLTINACPDGSANVAREKEKATARCPSEEGSPECGFYKRLITENKILRNHILKSKLVTASPAIASRSVSASGSTPTSTPDSSNSSSNSSSSHNNTLTGDDDDDDKNKNSPNRPAADNMNLNIPITAKELHQMLNLPSPSQDEHLSLALGELYSGLTSSSSFPGGGAGNGEAKEHTMQIQQWLKQIISEAETEPFQNAEMLEFSKINN